MQNSEFWTMKEIGKLYGTTSHQVGRKLKEIGLRTPEGKPSVRAFSLGLVDRRFNTDGPGYCWAWHHERTCALLEDAGFVRKKSEAEV